MKLPFLVSALTPWEARLQAAVLAAARLLLQQERSDQLRSSSHVAAGSPPQSHHGSTPTQTGAAPVAELYGEFNERLVPAGSPLRCCDRS